MNEMESPVLCGQFQGYALADVFEKTTPAVRDRIIHLWQRNKALPAGIDPEQRARQAALVAFDAAGAAIGVTTVFQGALAQIGLTDPAAERYYFYRMFIQPADRVAELMRVMTNTTYDLLRARQIPDRPAGMVFVSENRKLMRRGMRRKLLTHGYEFIGQNKLGQDIVRRRF